MSRRLRRDDQGVSTVEFALVLPIFVLLVGIGVYFAWIFYTQTQLDRAASRAARYAAVPTTNGSYDYCQGLVVSQLNGDLFTGSVTAGDVVISDGTGAVLTGTETVTDEAACQSLGKTPSGFVKVKVTHDFTNPFAAIISPFTGTSSDLTVTGTGQVRVERQ